MRALITGVNGQDGSYLAELLLNNGYQVHGLVRRNSVAANQSTRVNHLIDNRDFHLHYGDVTDMANLSQIVKKVIPDEVYNLAAQSHVKVSEELPSYTADADAKGVLNLLELCTHWGFKIYQASTSEMFGNTTEEPQNEDTPLNPVSPYGAAKTYAHHLCNHYRKAYGLFITCGILFNHTSVRRGDTFIEQKIAKGFVEFKKSGKKFEIGNLNAKRDFGYTPEYVQAMWMMMNHSKPDNFVIGTGVSWSVESICTMAAQRLGISNIFDVVTPSYKYMRAQELDTLKADYTKAEKELGWKPVKMFPDILNEMIDHWLHVI